MSQTFLNPEALTLVARMELVARQVVEGFLTGRHPSPYHGSSVEYADHRPYAPGDEIRSIDWKLWARTDRYFVKLAKEQTNTRCTILLDTSRSMLFGSGATEQDHVQSGSKFEYSCYLAACLAYLMLRQNDAVGLALFDRGLGRFLPARSKGSHFRILLETMAAASPDEGTRIGGTMHELARRLRGVGLNLVYVGIESVSDDVLADAKRASMDLNEQSIRIRSLEDMGVRVKAMFMFGFPKDNISRCELNIDYALKLRPSFAQFSVFTPYPGTPVYQEYSDKISVDRFEDFTQWQLVFEHPTLSAKDIRRLLDRAYHRFYTNISWILKFLRTKIA